jgi:hypothetical protein
LLRPSLTAFPCGSKISFWGITLMSAVNVMDIVLNGLLFDCIK